MKWQIKGDLHLLVTSAYQEEKNTKTVFQTLQPGTVQEMSKFGYGAHPEIECCDVLRLLQNASFLFHSPAEARAHNMHLRLAQRYLPSVFAKQRFKATSDEGAPFGRAVVQGWTTYFNPS